MAKYMDQSGARHFAEALMSATKTINGQTIWGDGDMQVGGSAKQPVHIEDFSKVWESTNLNTAAVGEIIPIVGDGYTKHLPGDISGPASFGWAGYYVLLTEENINSAGENCLFVINTYQSSEPSSELNIYAYCLAKKDTSGGFTWDKWTYCRMQSVIQTTYLTFKTSVKSGKLIPGARYMITDYQAVPNTTYAKKDPMLSQVSDTYLFIQALTSNTYDENASLVEVIQTETDPDIGVYDVKYTIENKYFIDQDNGYGTITYMRDVASGNVAPWDWRMGKGIVSKDATKTTFNSCTNCVIARMDDDNNFPCITLDSCTDCNIGPYNYDIDLQNCQRVNIKSKSSKIYLQYVYDCNIGCGCDNIHMGMPLGSHSVQFMDIGNCCSMIFVLPTATVNATKNVIGNNCQYVQFAGSYITIGNNCSKIYLTGYTGNDKVTKSQYVTVGNNCKNIGLNTTFSDFNSLQTNNMHFDYCVIGDNCEDIRFSSTESSTYICTFSHCSFQNISECYIKPITTSKVTISYKSFKHTYSPRARALDALASTPTDWQSLKGDISYDTISKKFVFRDNVGSVWTNIA